MILRKLNSDSAIKNALHIVQKLKIGPKFIALKHEVSGVASIEFALVVPVLLSVMLGATGLFDLFQGARSTERGATTIVDLVTRQVAMDDDSFDIMVATAESIMGDYAESGSFEISISSIQNEFDSSSDPTLSVAWSKANVDSAVIKDDDLIDYDIPDIPEGETVILVKILSSYTPYVVTDEVGSVDYERYVIRRPRLADQIPYN